jgi:fructose-1,6-bisphosphatase/inositol monophosphatase family enzyme
VHGGAGAAPTTRQVRWFAAAALGLAEVARRLVRAGLRRPRSVRRKADRTLVTDLDIAIESRLRALIGRRFPDHGIVGEEAPPVRPESAYQWYIDPIDGTTSLVRGLPLFGTILGLHYRGRPLVGVIDLPVLGHRYHAALGLGAWRDHRRLRLRDVSRAGVADEIIAASNRPLFARFGAARAFDRLLREHPRVRGYGDCVAHAWAAEGSVGGLVDFGVHRWDIAATRILVEEAGGRFVIIGERGRGAGATFGILAGRPGVVRWLERRFG